MVPLQPIENVRWGRPTRLRVTRHNDTFSKLHLFGLRAERLVYLDADTIVLRNIDELFSSRSVQQRTPAAAERDAVRPMCCPGGWDAHISAVPDFGYACGLGRNAGVCRRAFARGDQFNSGVMVVRPSRALFEDMLVRRWTTGSMDGGDQGLLNSLARGWAGGPGLLPYRYNTFAHEELIARGNTSYGKHTFDVRRISVLHFSGLKPWSRGRSKLGPQSLRAFDRAMASYRRRCSNKASGRTRLRAAAQLHRDMLLAGKLGKHAGGKRVGVGRIHLHELYGGDV